MAKFRLFQLVGGACFGALLIWVSLSPLNPDWFSYQDIFENEGTYLVEQGRDPMFTALVIFFGSLGFSYELFREVLGYFFLSFIIYLSLRLSRGDSFSAVLSLFFSVAAFAFSRYSIQIREGLALTLVILAILRLDNRARSMGRVRDVIACVLMLLGALFTHILSGVFFLAVFASLVTSGVLRGKRWRFLIHFGCFVLGLFWLGSLFLGLWEEFFLLNLGDRVVEASTIGPAKIFLWFIYGMICFWLRRESVVIRQKETPQAFVKTIEFLTGPIALVALLSVYTLVLSEAPTLMVGIFSRVVHAIVAINLLLVARSSSKHSTLILISIFLILDQARAIFESISFHSSIDWAEQ